MREIFWIYVIPVSLSGQMFFYPSKPISNPADSYHIHFELVKYDRVERAFRYDFAYNKTDFVLISQLLDEFEMENILNIEDINVAFERFFDVMRMIINRCTPKCRKNISNHLPWECNKELKNLKNKIRKLRKVQMILIYYASNMMNCMLKFMMNT